MNQVTFADLNLAEPLQRALADKNYTIPSPIQSQSIPHLLEGKDLLGCAQTGTGKTAAFALPILHRLSQNPKQPSPKSPRVLILTPTRELASQIGQSFADYGKYLSHSHTVIFGGVGQNPQVRAVSRGIDVVIATPGRLLDLCQQRAIRLDSLEVLVLDEADRMLDMGFINDVRKILSQIPKQRQTLFFSATMPPVIQQLAETILTNPVKVEVAPVSSTAERIDQRICFLDNGNKPKLLLHMLQEHQKGPNSGLTLVFSRTKHGANRLSEQLSKAGVRAEAIHGNKSQGARERALENFRTGRSPVLVATDIAARGIDVKGITLVINYDLPNEPESYVHRIGRTARAGAEGVAVAFCNREEMEFLRDIEKLIRKTLVVNSEHPFHVEGMVEAHKTLHQPRQGRPQSQAPARFNGQRNMFRSRGARQQNRSYSVAR